MTHLRKLKDGTYEVRMVVPADCRAVIGQANLTRRLGRISKAQANKSAAPVVIEFQARIEAARLGAVPGATPPSSKPAGLVDPRSATLIFERWRATESERILLLIFNGMDPEPPAPDMTADLDAWVSWKASRSRLRRCLRAEEWERIEDFDARMLAALREGGLDVGADHPALGRLRPLFAAAWSNVLEAADGARFGRDEAADVVETGPSIAAAMPLPYAPLLELFEGYAAERDPVDSTVKRWRPVMNNLVAHIGHDDASRFTPNDIVAWKTGLLARKAAKTVRDVYLAALKTVLSWAVENRKIAGNVAAGIRVRAAKRAVVTRERAFTKAEFQTILRAALEVERGRLSVEHWRARRWVPWLCAYTGARVGEIGQLRGCDVVEIEGVFAVRITPDAGTVKTGTMRVVPLHPHLLEMGFVKMARAVGDGPLFFNPGRGRGGSKGNPHSKKVGERLAAWVRALGVDHPELQPNHAWRHLFKTRARMARIEGDARDAIQGHAPRTEGEAYGHWPILALAEAINQLPRFEV